MPTLIQTTEWHQSPMHDDTKYHQIVLDDDGVTLITVISSVPLSALTPSANILVPGPDLVVSGNVQGLWADGAALNVDITVTGGTSISTVVVNDTGATMTPQQMAAHVAGILNTLGAGDIQCAANENVVGISALAGVTALTIVAWAVAP